MLVSFNQQSFNNPKISKKPAFCAINPKILAAIKRDPVGAYNSEVGDTWFVYKDCPNVLTDLKETIEAALKDATIMIGPNMRKGYQDFVERFLTNQ